MTKKKVVQKTMSREVALLSKQVAALTKEFGMVRHFYAQNMNKMAWLGELMDTANRLGENMQSLSIIERLVKAIDQLTIASDTLIRGPVKPNPVPHPPKRKRK